MQKVILDTNVVVSALIQKSYPHYIIYEYVLGGYMQLCLSDALLDEYRDVLSRSKFAKIPNFKSNSEIILNRLIKTALFYEPTIKLEIIKDASDNKLLELADESAADFLITGNSNDFTMPSYNHTRILSPRSFWESFYL
jgi:putative PIN family toxin of toxin-antitoxin system